MIRYLCVLVPCLVNMAMPAQMERPEVPFEKGMNALRAGLLPEAERDFLQATRLDPSSPPAFINLGVVFMREKRWPEALGALRKAERLSPDMGGIHLNLGLVYYRSGEFAKAVPEFRVAGSHGSQGGQAEYLLGLSCFFSDDYECAVGALEPLWTEQSSNLTYLYVLGSAAGRAKKTSLEAKAFEQMPTVGGDTALFHLYMGKALIGKQKFGDAIHELNKAANASPPLPMAHYYLAEAQQGQHNEEAARGELLAEIRLEPDVAYSYDQLGHVCSLLGRNDEAENAYREAIARDPSLSTSYVGLAGIYRSQARYVQALEMVDRALKLQPKSGSIHYSRGRLLKLMHREPEAKAEFERSASLLREFNDETQQARDSSRKADTQQIRDAAQL